ncbi:MAG: hypothetical protein LC776_12920 [Acidobacteria bacterium]|nr:hypothetical protein [Acidobacteriota bacterium]
MAGDHVNGSVAALHANPQSRAAHLAHRGPTVIYLHRPQTGRKVHDLLNVAERRARQHTDPDPSTIRISESRMPGAIQAIHEVSQGVCLAHLLHHGRARAGNRRHDR